MTKYTGRRRDAHVRCFHVLVGQRALFDATPGGQNRFAQFERSIADLDRLTTCPFSLHRHQTRYRANSRSRLGCTASSLHTVY